MTRLDTLYFPDLIPRRHHFYASSPFARQPHQLFQVGRGGHRGDLGGQRAPSPTSQTTGAVVLSTLNKLSVARTHGPLCTWGRR